VPVSGDLPEMLMAKGLPGRSTLSIMPVFRRGHQTRAEGRHPTGSDPMTVTPAQNKRNAWGNRRGRRMTARMRAFRRRAAAWRRRVRRAAFAALMAATVSGSTGVAQAQMGGMGQAAMAPSGGLINRAVSRSVAGLENLNLNGPGWMYFGINPADRGLGYNGGYITLGGFIPYAEDDMGGFWAADLRGHLSEYGGFFSNVGAVRKQFIGGTLLGVGVYWDYDGDQNQYPTGGLPGTEQYGQFGHSYNQVGVSGEWLTDYGNLRSNGYIPVGSTAYTVGNPGVPFFQNYIMCQNGLDAALGGADLEVGAYIPALADWAGMISVGGYALGNTRYDWSSGPLPAHGVVPWFGGVYTRLDMTFIENWDFSIQYNNDSYFDSTGFVRLIYRMGGSRRRNVPDQMEQPMMRNEHIVRAHQTPVVVQNPQAGNANWNVIHVNNAVAAGGNGTFEAPFRTLAEADAAAANPWDIVYVNEGLSTTSSSGLYGGTFSFNAMNQSLVGSGGEFVIASQPNCGVNGLYTIAAQTAANPVLSNPGGPSVVIPGTGGATVSNFSITGSQTGIIASGNLSAGTTPSRVDNVTIAGDGTANEQRGVQIDSATGNIEFTDTSIANMTRSGLLIQNGSANVSYSGVITSDTALTAGIASPLIQIRNNTGGTNNIGVGNPPSGSLITANSISDTGGEGIIIQNNTGGETNIGNISLTNTVNAGVYVFDDQSTISIRSDAGTGITRNNDGAAILINQGAPNFTYFGTINNAPPAGGAPGYLLYAADTTGGSITLGGPGATPLSDTGDGILLQRVNSEVNVTGASLASTGTQAIRIEGSPGGAATGTYSFNNISVTGGTQNGILLSDLSGTTSFSNLTMSLGGLSASGLSATNAGTVSIGGSSSIQTSSTTMPAIKIYDNGSGGLTTPDLSLTSVISANTTTGAAVLNPPFAAISLESANPGFVSISNAFTVGNAAGTAANVTNPAGVPVFVTGAQISP
jgi:hypothetical protein